MSASDAILIGEDWISEHYFTTDATSQSFRAQVLARRKLWDGQQETGSVRSRFTSARASLLAWFASLDGESEPGHELSDLLGYGMLGLTREDVGPVTFVRQASLPESASVALVVARPAETVEALLEKDAETLVAPYDFDESTQIRSVPRLLSALFVADGAPAFALVLAGRLVLLAERERWPEGRYLAIDLQLVCERGDDRRGGETDVALTCLSAESLAPDAEGTIWWHGVLEESIKHTVGVSQDLREGVRLSIEIIANDVVARRARQGLEPLPESEAQPLAQQSLRFLYRVLFLLYAEASPELAVLPVGVPEYEQGYSLDRLRELIQVPLTTPQSETGTHLYDSLAVLFKLVDRGVDPATASEDEGMVEALTFRALRADLFNPSATAHINEVKLGNAQLQRVLQHLLLSKEKRGSDRGFISYAELGINQLGAVYEGLMSFSGRFAETDLYEVARGGDGSKGTWLVPFDRADSIDDKDFVRSEDPVTGEPKPVLHREGTFVFRLAGRERQQSASYYTPEVLTRFTVNQALAELIAKDTAAEEILRLTVCEPALGSGAFAIEAVRQLAAEYLARRQDELGKRIEPEDYPAELQKAKAYLALHNVYGVDRNAMAVELAEISLWLDTMMAGLEAPWFGLHLRRGNSLIGARHAVFARSQLERRSWLKDAPREIPLTELPDNAREGREGSASGRIHHFLVPAEGWGATVDAKEKQLAPEAVQRLKQWRASVLAKPTKAQLDAQIDLGRRVEALWDFSWRRLTIAESEIRRDIEVWGAEGLASGGAVTREQIEASLADPDSAYRRLRRVMDAWCALWFWPLTTEIAPPDLNEWIATLQQLLGVAGKGGRRTGQLSFGSAASWEDLGVAERADLEFALAVDVREVIAQHPWLAVAEAVAERQGFFHWQLDFAPVFARGGFDLQVGNPPWVRPRSDVEALLAEADPWWQLKGKSTAQEDADHRAIALAIDGTRELLLDGTAEVAATAAFLGAPAEYPHLVGLQPDLYRCFMEQTWRHAGPAGAIALISLESHFTDQEAERLRRETYRRLRRHWQFINELMLFEIEHHKRYGVSVFGSPREPSFLQAVSLYHPDTVERSIQHDGSGSEPGIKDADGQWDVRPHAARIIRVTPETLASWQSVLGVTDTPVDATPMVYTVNRATATVLDKLAAAPRISALGVRFSRGWDESIDRKKGLLEAEWGVPDTWGSAILQGPHLHVANPCFKQPNPSMRNNADWTAVDLETLPARMIPATSYKARGDRDAYDAAYTHWPTASGGQVSAREHFRVAWRKMAANTGERTLISAVIPRGSAHIHGLLSLAPSSGDGRELVDVAAQLATLMSDLLVRTAPKANILTTTVERLPLVARAHPLLPAIRLRYLRLTCLTDPFAELWDACFEDGFRTDAWAGDAGETTVRLQDVGPTWEPATPLRRAVDRRRAIIELDALVALALGVTADELATVYRTQFPVLAGYDRNAHVYDGHGRLVPNAVLTAWRRLGDATLAEERTATHPGSGVAYEYVLPFRTLDREADLRRAHQVFEGRL